MSKIVLSSTLRFPPEVVTQTIGILGRRGSGKTTTASVLVEQLLLAKLPVVVIDPTDAWWGLKSSKNGHEEGFPITVLGGDYGDDRLEETGGKTIADLVAEEAPPLVLSLSSLSGAASRRFVRDFAERLYERNRTALHVVIDEADEFVPQRLFKDALAVFGAVDKLVRRGRKKGIGVTLISQRSAAINKDVLSQCEVLIAHRASHPTDIDPVLTWMRAAHMDRVDLIDKVQQTIAKLGNGEAWVMSAEWLDVFDRFQMNDRVTFNSSATPEPGARRVEPRKLAKPDLAALRVKMREHLERARARDPNALLARVAELERALADRPAAAPAKERRVEVPVLADANLARLERLSEKLSAWAERLARLRDRSAQAEQTVVSEMGNLTAEVRALRERASAPPPPPPAPARPPPASVAPRASRRRAAEGNGEARDGALRRGQRAMLAALAYAGFDGLDHATLAVWTTMRRSGTFSDYLGALHTAGYAEKGVDGRERITAAGSDALRACGETAGRPSSATIIEAWKQKHLRAGQRDMIDALLPARRLTREELGDAVGMSPTSGTFSDYLGFLHTSGLVTRGDDGREQLSRSVTG